MESPPISSQALPAGTRIEEFVIERVLGSGGFGITYLARDASLNRQVVIKENLPAQFSWRDPASGTVRPRATHSGEAEDYLWSMQNFLREADTLASLDHPGIVRVLRKFEANGTAYFVMPFVDGIALDELIEERQRENEWFTEIELTGMLSRLLGALDYLHARGIYHRDIKPGNILITSEGIPMLIDFGSARQRLSERSMTVVESAGYTPFEQLQSRGEIGPWSDLYALGATLVKAITGTAPPKAADRVMGDPWQGVSRDAQWMKVYSTSFLQSIDKVLSVKPAQRWQSGSEWLQRMNANPSTPHPAVDAMTAATNLSPLQPPLTGMDDSSYIPSAQSETTNDPVTFRPQSARKVSKGTRQTLIAGACGLMFIGAALLAIQKSGDNQKPDQTEIQKAVVTPLSAAEVEPAVVSAPSPGGLVITSEPSGAELTSGTREVLGKTPVELTGLAAEQPWQGTLALEGYVPAEVKADVVSGETKLVAPVKLKPQAQKIIVSSEPSGAEVVEDGKVVGSTPWESNPREVGDGVALTLRKPGHDDTGLSGQVLFGKTLILQGTLKTTPQQVVVTSEPTGAEVLEGGTVIGKTPMELGGQEPGKAVAYTLRLEGHEEGGVTGKVKVGEALRLSTALKALPKLKMEGIKAGEERDFEIAPGVKITMCWIPAGEFVMGSPTAELGREADEVQHRVRITKGFWLGKYEVTQAQWRACGGVDPSARPPSSVAGEVKVSWAQLVSQGIRAANFKGADLPVERVSWDEAADWCEGLNAGGRAKGGPEAEWRYGLPTEAQWEYANRGGTLTALNSGKNLTSKEGECRNLGELAWYNKNSGLRTHDVGGKKANAWGLHDMHGNVWEWCSDWHGTYPSGVAVDPVGARSGSSRVYRGGSWYGDAGNCRVAGRDSADPAYYGSSMGFRTARSSVP